MNFPDLKTCKIISGEFPDSQYVWACEEDTFLDRCRSYIFKGGGAWHVYDKKHIRTSQLDDTINSPTCEELGDWLARPRTLKRFGGHPVDLSLMFVVPTVKGWWGLLCRPSGGSWGDAFEAENETQARALAVKQILEEQ